MISTTTMKTLILMRHGEAAQASTDFERALTPRGQQQVRESAREVDQINFTLRRVLTSSAPRATATAELVASELGFQAPIEAYSSLYLAPAGRYLEMIKSSPSETTGLVLVAHNPGISELASALCGARISLETGAWAMKQFDGSWTDLGATTYGS